MAGMKELAANTKKTWVNKIKWNILREIPCVSFFFIVFSERGIITMIFHKFQKYRKGFFLTALFCLLCFSINLLFDSIPDEIYVVKGEEESVHFSVPVTVEKEEVSVPVLKSLASKAQVWNSEAQSDNYRLSCKFLNLIPVKEVNVHVIDKTYVMPSGMPVGIYTKTKGVLIIGTGKVASADGLNYEPADQIVKGGDYITSVNGMQISLKEELISCVNNSGGKPLILGILRDEKQIEVKVEPVKLSDGTYKLGIWVRDDMAGVGTLTYIKDNLEYGALGHPVSDADTGCMIRLEKGNVYQTNIVGIVKGKDGAPGELTGVINYKKENCLGTIAQNTKTGIYGTLDAVPEEMEDAVVEAGLKQDIRRGEAYILSSLDGVLRQFRIEIEDVDFHSKEENKGILFHVTDELLLSETGGIVQGMSGSPILQDGKIIGAVTHVFVSDATKGYGVFIEKMLEH